MDERGKAILSEQAEKSLEMLKAGNLRHITGNTKDKNLDKKQREALGKGQKPYATILSCADSRVSPEIVFDAGLGELFVVRNAGNVATESALASIEYAAVNLDCPLVVVIAHSNCGAVSAASSTGSYTENIDKLIGCIKPAVCDAACVNEASKNNARRMAEEVLGDSTIAESGAWVIAAYYEIETGKVIWL